MNFRPLWTAIVWPTMSGMIVDRRDQVLTTLFSRVVLRAATFFIRWSSTKGPFLIERDIVLSLRLAAPHDEIVGPLVVASLHALGLPAPRRGRVASARGLAFA